MATSLRQGPRRNTGARQGRAEDSVEQADWLAEVDRRPPIPARRSRDLSWLARWMPDLDEPLRVAHEKSWGLMAVAGAVIAGGLTVVATERPEFDVWVAVLLGAFAGILALPVLAILVRLGLVLLVVAAAVVAAWYFA